MPNLPAKRTTPGPLVRRDQLPATRPPAPAPVIPRPAVRDGLAALHIPERLAHCLACAEDRNRDPDGRFPAAVALVELPSWAWEGPVCDRHLREAREAARADHVSCVVRQLKPDYPVAPYQRAMPNPAFVRPRTRPRFTLKGEPNATIEISGYYGG